MFYGLSFDYLIDNFRYQNLIKKAVKEGVIVERNTLSDFFLQPTNECKANISAACLPYCENDFWPGEVERLLEKKDDKTSQKQETQVGRLLRVAKRDDRKGNLEDILLVHKVILVYLYLAFPAFCGYLTSCFSLLLAWRKDAHHERRLHDALSAAVLQALSQTYYIW